MISRLKLLDRVNGSCILKEGSSFSLIPGGVMEARIRAGPRGREILAFAICATIGLGTTFTPTPARAAATVTPCDAAVTDTRTYPLAVMVFKNIDAAGNFHFVGALVRETSSGGIEIVAVLLRERGVHSPLADEIPRVRGPTSWWYSNQSNTLYERHVSRSSEGPTDGKPAQIHPAQPLEHLSYTWRHNRRSTSRPV